MHRCPDCAGSGVRGGCPSGIPMYCSTCGGSGAVSFEDCQACVLKDGKIKVLEAEIEELKNSIGWRVQKSLGEDIQNLSIRAEAAEKKAGELDQALNSAISSAVEARKERDADEKALADLLDELKDIERGK